MTAAGAGAVEVFVFKDGRFLGSRCYSQSVVTIGRGRGATLKLLDPTVSEQHAVLTVEGGNLVIRDHGSQGGVFVNGERVEGRAVSSFDEISIGPFRLKMTILGQEEEDAGFGTEGAYESEAATVVRRVEHLPEYASQPPPASAGMDEATLPRIVRPKRPETFDQEETLAFGGPRKLAETSRAPSFRASDALGSAPAPVPSLERAGYEEAPTKAETPGRIKPAMGDGSFEDFSRPPAEPAPAPAAPARRAPAPAPAAPSSRHAPAASNVDDVHSSATRRAVTIDAPLIDEEPEPSAGMDEPTGDEPDWSAAAPAEEGDDDDDEIESWVEPFSLLENVVREKFKGKVETEPFVTVEVIHYQGNQILDLMRADPGRTVRVGPERFRLAMIDKTGRASLFFRSDFKGTLVTKGKARSLKTFMNERFALKKGKGDLYAVALAEGDYAQIIVGTSGYLVRFVRPPVVPRATEKRPFNWGNLQIFVGSAAFHFLILVLLGFVAPEADLTVVTDAERFAKVAVKDLNLEKPKEEPKQEEPPKTEEPKPEPTKETPKVRKKIKRPGPARPVSEKQRAKIQKKQVANVLSALENVRPKNAGPGRSDLKSLVSNIAAVRAPGGTASSFKVAGVIGKIPGGGVRLAGGIGGGGKDTRVGSQLLSGGSKIGKIAALAGTGNRVRGRVRRAPTRAISATGGVLDRGAIQKVVNAHMSQIQRCYEVQLLKNPGLSGKIVFDWVISPSGGVSSARQVSSSLASPMVSTCILALIRTWRFPQPVGGAVQVRYPFVFRVQGF